MFIVYCRTINLFSYNNYTSIRSNIGNKIYFVMLFSAQRTFTDIILTISIKLVKHSIKFFVENVELKKVLIIYPIINF